MFRTWNYEQLFGGTLPHCLLLPLHFLHLPTPIFFFRLETFACRCQAANTAPWWLLKREKLCMNRNQWGTYTLQKKKATFPSGSWIVRNRHPLGPQLKSGDAGHASQPGSSDIPANTKSSPISKQEDNHIKRIGCVWLCAQSVASARRQPAPYRITQAEQQPSSPLGCAA